MYNFEDIVIKHLYDLYVNVYIYTFTFDNFYLYFYWSEFFTLVTWSY